MTLLGAAVAAARNTAKISSTRATIEKLNTIISQQYLTYASRPIAAAATTTIAAAARRQLATADMPEMWAEVQTLKETYLGLANQRFPINGSQRAYVSYRDAISPLPSPKFEDAECLFMIVMVGGLADCLDCRGLGLSDIGDKDGDQAPEFWDAWGNPIGFVLWPAGLELPPGGGKFFSTTAPFVSGSIALAPGGTMRPLIYSSGPDGKATFAVPTASQIKTGTNCGNPADVTAATLASFAAPLDDPVDRRADNITNFDAEAKQ
jgi:hypothetical protein